MDISFTSDEDAGGHSSDKYFDTVKGLQPSEAQERTSYA